MSILLLGFAKGIVITLASMAVSFVLLKAAIRLWQYVTEPAVEVIDVELVPCDCKCS